DGRGYAELVVPRGDVVELKESIAVGGHAIELVARVAGIGDPKVADLDVLERDPRHVGDVFGIQRGNLKDDPAGHTSSAVACCHDAPPQVATENWRGSGLPEAMPISPLARCRPEARPPSTRRRKTPPRVPRVPRARSGSRCAPRSWWPVPTQLAGRSARSTPASSERAPG